MRRMKKRKNEEEESLRICQTLFSTLVHICVFQLEKQILRPIFYHGNHKRESV